MGVDPGTRYAGYGVIKHEKQKTNVISYGCIDVHKKKNLVDKIGTLYDHISAIVNEQKVTLLSLETPFLYKNASTFLKLGYVRGILYLIAYQNDLNLKEFSPREVKQGITGYGNASKEQVANVIKRIFHLKDPQRDDITDALGIALCGLWTQKK